MPIHTLFPMRNASGLSGRNQKAYLVSNSTGVHRGNPKRLTEPVWISRQRQSAQPAV